MHRHLKAGKNDDNRRIDTLQASRSVSLMLTTERAYSEMGDDVCADIGCVAFREEQHNRNQLQQLGKTDDDVGNTSRTRTSTMQYTAPDSMRMNRIL